MDGFHYVPDKPYSPFNLDEDIQSVGKTSRLIKGLLEGAIVGTCRIKGYNFECRLLSDSSGFYLEEIKLEGKNTGYDLHKLGIKSHTWYRLDFLPANGNPEIKTIWSNKAIVEGLCIGKNWSSTLVIRLHTLDILHGSSLLDGDAFCTIRSSRNDIPFCTCQHNEYEFTLSRNAVFEKSYDLRIRTSYGSTPKGHDYFNDILPLLYRIISPWIGTNSDIITITSRLNGKTVTKVCPSNGIDDDIPSSRYLNPIHSSDFLTRAVRLVLDSSSRARDIVPALHTYSSNQSYYTQSFLSAFICLEGMVTSVSEPSEIYLSSFVIQEDLKKEIFSIISSLTDVTPSQKQRLKDAIKGEAKGKKRKSASNLIWEILRRLNADVSEISLDDLNLIADCRNSVAHTTRLSEDKFGFGVRHIEEISRIAIDSLFCAILKYQGGLRKRTGSLTKYVPDEDPSFA